MADGATSVPSGMIALASAAISAKDEPAGNASLFAADANIIAASNAIAGAPKGAAPAKHSKQRTTATPSDEATQYLTTPAPPLNMPAELNVTPAAIASDSSLPHETHGDDTSATEIAQFTVAVPPLLQSAPTNLFEDVNPSIGMPLALNTSAIFSKAEAASPQENINTPGNAGTKGDSAAAIAIDSVLASATDRASLATLSSNATAQAPAAKAARQAAGEKSSVRTIAQSNATPHDASHTGSTTSPGAASLSNPDVSSLLTTPVRGAAASATSASGDLVSPAADAPTRLSTHSGNARADASSASAASGMEEDAPTSTGPEHNALASAADMHAVLTPLATPQTTFTQQSAPELSQLVTLQSVHAAVASVPQAESSTAPSVPAQPPAQSAPIAEPEHAMETAQLSTQGNLSELKISVQLPALGKVEVRAVSTHETTTAHVTAFRHDVVPVLAAERAGLEDVLRSHNVILGSLGSQAQANGQQRQQNSHTPVQPQGNAAREVEAAAIAAETLYPGFLPEHASISVRA